MDNERPTDTHTDSELLLALEFALRQQGAAGDFKDARSALRTYLWRKAETEPQGSIPDAVDVLAAKEDHNPDVAAILLRTLAVPNFLPSGAPGSHFDSH